MIKQMKRILFLVFVIASFNLYGQDTTYYDSTHTKVNNMNEASNYEIISRSENDTNKVIDKEYFKSGRMKYWFQYSNYSKRIRHGKQFEFYPDGKPKSEIDFFNGKNHGLLKTWYENGQKKRIDSFNMDEFITGKCYSIKGIDTAYFEYNVQPKYPGGEEARQKYLRDNIIYPDSAEKNGIQGTVYITFIIEPDGSITNAKVIKGAKELSGEALRVVEKMPKWNPGWQDGNKVRVKINMPIKFVVR
jgi:TonB family protein